jgi:hypothetical protein
MTAVLERTTHVKRRRLIVEAAADATGGAQHPQVASWHADTRQHNEIAGEILLRFPAWQVRHKPGEVVAQVRAALHRAGWTG